jgi:hypothetical protein
MKTKKSTKKKALLEKHQYENKSPSGAVKAVKRPKKKKKPTNVDVVHEASPDMRRRDLTQKNQEIRQ